MRVLGALWARLFPNPTYYGWVVVGLGFICSVLTSPGQSFVISLYLEPVMGDLGLSRVEISSLYAMATLAGAACLPVVGKWADRVPSGRFLGTVLALLGLSMAGFAAVRTVAGLAVAFFLLRLLGQGVIGLGTITATVRWFRRYRGRALAVVGLGYAFGGAVYPGVVYALFERIGWRGSLLALAAVYVLVAAPLVGWLVRERRPSDCPVDGGATGRVGEIEPEHVAEVSFTLRQALRMPVFWGLLLSMAIVPMVHTAAVFHQVALFGSVGWSAEMVPPAFVAYAVGGVVMTYATGLVLESMPSRLGLSASLALSTLAFAVPALPLSASAGALLYGAMLGLASGAHAATRTILWPDYFGVEALGSVKGVVGAAMSGATALGPPLAAMLVAASGSFGSSLAGSAIACGAGAAASLWLRKPIPRPEGGAGVAVETRPGVGATGRGEAA